MKPVDHVMPTSPSNWVRRPDDRRRKKTPGRQREDTSEQPRKHPPEPDPDGRIHIIDDLA